MQLLKRAAALACSLALCASLMPAAVFADEGTEPSVTSDTPAVQSVSFEKLTDEKLKGLLAGKIEVACSTDADEHELQYMDLIGSADKDYDLDVDYWHGKATLTLNQVNAYADQYDERIDYDGNHRTLVDGSNVTITLSYKRLGFTKWGWVVDDGQTLHINLECDGEKPIPELSNEKVQELFANQVKVECSTEPETHGFVMMGLQGEYGTDYSVAVDMDKGTATLTIEQFNKYADKYDEEKEYSGNHLTLVDGSVKTATLSYDAVNGWTVDAGQQLYIKLECDGEEAVPELTDSMVQDLFENNVKVYCKDMPETHTAMNTSLIEGTYTFVQTDDTATLYIDQSTPYTNKFNAEHGKHLYEVDGSICDVALSYDKESGAWKVVSDYPALALTCDGAEQPGTDAPKLPDYDYIKENIHGAVIVKCVNENAAHDTKIYYAEVMGPEGGDSYKVVRDSEDVNKATIQLNVRDIGLYTGVMDEQTGIDHTYVAEGSTLEVKLFYDKVWKLDERAVVNVKCTTTGGNTGDSGNTDSSCDHDYVWQHSPDEHWQYCNKCGQVISNGAHNFQWKDGYQECTVCGYRVTTTSTAASANNSANNGTAATAAGNTSTAAAATSVNGIPQTSDEMPLGLLAGSTVIAAAAFVALTLLRKRRQQ